MSDEFGVLILRQRKYKHMTRTLVAKRAGISPSTLRTYEMGGGAPNIYTVENICNALGMRYTIGDSNAKGVKGFACDFAKFIRGKRKGQKLSRKELSEKIGISDRTIERYELGYTKPLLWYAELTCKYFNVSYTIG